MLSMPVRKLPAWLNSINPKKVRPELRERIELYQAECDDALWNYWMRGKAERPTASPLNATASPSTPITPADQSILQSIVKAKVEALPEERRSKGIYPQIWGRFNNHFRLGSYRQLPQCRMAEAVAYLTQMPVREALLPAQDESLDAHLAAIRTHINDILNHQAAIFSLGRKALPARPSRPGGPAPALWDASVLSLYGLEESCNAQYACLKNLEFMARAVIAVAHV